MCHNSSPPASLIVYVEQSNREWLLLAVQLPHEVCTYSAWGPSVLPRLPFHSLREQVISSFVHWSKQAYGVVNVLHGWEGEKTADCKRDRDTHMRAHVHTHTCAHTHTRTHTRTHTHTPITCTETCTCTNLIYLLFNFPNQWSLCYNPCHNVLRMRQQQQVASNCSHAFRIA